MKASFIIASVFAALVAAAPATIDTRSESAVEIEARQVRASLSSLYHSRSWILIRSYRALLLRAGSALTPTRRRLRRAQRTIHEVVTTLRWIPMPLSAFLIAYDSKCILTLEYAMRLIVCKPCERGFMPNSSKMQMTIPNGQRTTAFLPSQSRRPTF
jgi:hypothetical protein